MNKLCYIYPKEYYIATKKNALLIPAIAGINLQITLWNEVEKKKKVKLDDSTYIQL